VTVVGTAAIALGMTVGTGVASGAATTPKSTAGLHAHLSRAAAGGRLSAVLTTAEGAGYYSYPTSAHGLAGASTSFKMPAITCASASDQEWLLPGIWVYSGGSLSEQVDVNFNCNSGSLLESAVICIAGSCDQTLAVAPHDTIRASIAYTPSATIGTIKDVTSGLSKQVVGPAVTTDDVVFIGDEGPSMFFGGIVTKVPTFTSVKFSNNQVNAQDLSDWAPGRYNLKTTTKVQIRTSALNANQSFVTTFAKN